MSKSIKANIRRKGKQHLDWVYDIMSKYFARGKQKENTQNNCLIVRFKLKPENIPFVPKSIFLPILNWCREWRQRVLGKDVFSQNSAESFPEVHLLRSDDVTKFQNLLLGVGDGDHRERRFSMSSGNLDSNKLLLPSKLNQFPSLREQLLKWIPQKFQCSFCFHSVCLWLEHS